jgi:hypothetical protein
METLEAYLARKCQELELLNGCLRERLPLACPGWFHDATADRYSVRVAVPDLPTPLWDELTEAITRWCGSNQPDSVAA